ncbi:hypothetical protein ACEPAI_1543 [Sanghuangporus weigelae]
MISRLESYIYRANVCRSSLSLERIGIRMRFRAPEYYDSDEEEEEEEEDSTPAVPPAPSAPLAAAGTSNAVGPARGAHRTRIRELHILSKKKQAKHKRRGKGMIGMKRFEAYRDAYLARRRGQHGQGPPELGREEERKSEHPERALSLSRESAAPMVVDIGNPLACGLGRAFDDFVRNLAGGSGSGNGNGNGNGNGKCNGRPSSGSYIAPGAFPGLSMDNY